MLRKKIIADYLIEDFNIKKVYNRKMLLILECLKVIIERTSKKCIVSIHTSRPGFVIGKKGS